MNYALLATATTKINPHPIMALEALLDEMNAAGPFAVAKKYGCLVNGSAEDFAIEAMTAGNAHQPGRY